MFLYFDLVGARCEQGDDLLDHLEHIGASAPTYTTPFRGAPPEWRGQSAVQEQVVQGPDALPPYSQAGTPLTGISWTPQAFGGPLTVRQLTFPVPQDDFSSEVPAAQMTPDGGSGVFPYGSRSHDGLTDSTG